MSGWPFWAATSDHRIERALDMAGLRSGEHLVDLGSGDGRVLMAAARRGARVTGVEVDPLLASATREMFADHGVVGEVIEGDFDQVDLGDADVVFAFLSPATLQRLRPRLTSSRRPGARAVTTGYAVPGWEPVAAVDRCYLYRVPVEERAVDRQARGWDSPGVLVGLRPDVPSLVAVKLHASAGPLSIAVSGDLARWTAARPGADEAGAGDEVVVDLRFDPQPAGTVGHGTVEAVGSGIGSLALFAVVDGGDAGVWGLSEVGCRAAATDPRAVLAGARGEGRP